MHVPPKIRRAVLARPQDASGAPKPEILLTLFYRQPLPAAPLNVELVFTGELRAGAEVWREEIERREETTGMRMVTLLPARGTQLSIAARVMCSGGEIETISELRVGTQGGVYTGLVRSADLRSVEFVPTTSRAQLYNMTAVLIAQILEAITGVTLKQVTPLQWYDPPLGTLGGAGTPVPATRVTLTLSVITATQARFLRELARTKPGAISWALEGQDGRERKQRTLKWEMSRYEEGCLLLTIESPDGVVVQPQWLSATLKGDNRSFQWSVARATERAS